MFASRSSKVSNSFQHRRRPSRRATSALLAASHVERLEQRTMLATISGTRYNDFNQNGIKDGTDVFVPGQIVYVDSGAPGYDGSAFSSSDIPKTIADVSTVTSNLIVGGMSGTISDVNVTLNISHTFDGDVDIFLISPTGTRIELSTDNGSSADNYYFTTFDDEATTLITAGVAPYNGYFKPEGLLSSVDGQNPNGTWKLECTDDASGIAGVLDSWSLQFNTTEISTTTDKNGAYSIVGLPAGTHTLREVNTLGWVYSQPASGQYSINLATSTTVSSGNAFGAYLPPGNVRGRVWQDNNGDGTAQHAEPALAGWTVYLDANDNGIKEAGEASSITDGTGNYAFDNITPRTYVVRVQAPAGFAQTTPTGSGIVLRVGAGSSGGPNVSVAGTNKAGKYSLTDVVANLTGRRALSDLASYLNANPDSPLNGMLDLGKSSRQILRTTNSTTMTQLQLKPGVDPVAAVEALKEIPNVKWASTNAIFDTAALGDPRELTPNDPQYPSQYMHTKMQNNLAWDTTIGDSNMIVAVTDDGVDWNHQDLAAGIWNNTDEIAANGIDDDGNGYIDDTRGWDFWSNDNNPIQNSPDTHGNHTSGIVGARINNNVGVVGTSPGVQIMPVKFYGSSGNTWTATMVASSYAYAVDNGAKIISTSYNVDGFVNNLAFEAALNYVYSHGVLHFNSAGNNSQQNPARQKYDQSLYVASTNSSDVKSSFSNYGWGTDISAPGENILSTYPNNTYQTISGTSMSTPNAAAVAALIWSAHPTWTRDQVAAQLIGTADNIDAANPTLVNQLGGGRANSFKGVNNTLTGPKLKANTLVGLPAEGSTVASVGSAFTLDVANVLDSTAANNINNWTLKGDGPDNTFGTADDANIPLTLGTNIMLGTNRISFTIPNVGALQADTYRFSITANVKDPFGNSFDGNGDGTAGDAYTRTFTLGALASPYRVNLTSNQTVEGANFGEIPTAYTGSQFTLSLDAGGNNVQVWVDQPTSGAPTYTAAKAVFTNMTFAGGAGADSLTIDYRNGYPIPNSGLAFNGNGGANDTLTIIGTTGADTATFNTGLISMGGVISYTNVESLSFDGNGGLDVVNVNGGLNVSMPASQTFASMNVANGASASMVTNGTRTLKTNTLSIGATGKLDLNDNDAVVKSTPLSTIRGYIATAYNFGDWLGAGGLFSSTARSNALGTTTLGLMTGQEFADNNGGTFNGITPAATDTLVKYTYFGDVDFNGAVDVSDYNLIDFGFANHLTGWTNGDVDYSNGATDVSDYNLIDVAFASQIGVL